MLHIKVSVSTQLVLIMSLIAECRSFYLDLAGEILYLERLVSATLRML